MTTLDSTSLHRYLEQFTATFTPELVEHFAALSPNAEFQARLDVLGDKANDGTLSMKEQQEYDTYIEAMDVVAGLRVSAMLDEQNGRSA